MKKLLVLIALVCSVAASAQKPTGGCAFYLNIATVTSIPKPLSRTLIFNGRSLEIELYEDIVGFIYVGQLTVDIDGTNILKIDTFYPALQNVVHTDTLHFANGKHRLNVVYNDAECGRFEDHRTITIQDQLTVLPPQPEDSLALIYPNIHPSDFLSYYPNPASEFINIDGLRASETKYTVQVTDMGGKDYRLNGISRYRSLIVIPTAELPPGYYSISVVTGERTTKRLIEVTK